MNPVFIVLMFQSYVHIALFWQRSFERRDVPVSLTKLNVLTGFNLFVVSSVISQYMMFAANLDKNDIVVRMCKLAICYVCTQIQFYFTHRLLHMKWFYCQIHSIHHVWILPDPRATLYAHPIENLLLNAAPIVIPPLFFSMDWTSAFIWFNLAGITAVWGHAGVVTGQSKYNEHDLHHLIRKGQYGTGNWMDNLMKTSLTHSAVGSSVVNMLPSVF